MRVEFGHGIPEHLARAVSGLTDEVVPEACPEAANYRYEQRGEIEMTQEPVA